MMNDEIKQLLLAIEHFSLPRYDALGIFFRPEDMPSYPEREAAWQNLVGKDRWGRAWRRILYAVQPDIKRQRDRLFTSLDKMVEVELEGAYLRAASARLDELLEAERLGRQFEKRFTGPGKE